MIQYQTRHHPIDFIRVKLYNPGINNHICGKIRKKFMFLAKNKSGPKSDIYEIRRYTVLAVRYAIPLELAVFYIFQNSKIFFLSIPFYYLYYFMIFAHRAGKCFILAFLHCCILAWYSFITISTKTSSC